MDHLKALLIKFVMIAAVLLIVLTGIFDFEMGDSLLISLVLTVAAYVLGDLFIFRNSGDESDYGKRNLIATASDAVLAFLIIYLMGKALFVGDDNLVTAALLSTVLIGVGEWFFHKYLDNHVFDEHEGAGSAY
ncbi:DUF2512 family protein [Bacillus sp. T33-2]|uniref:DUF2512 family protein n=1 Tax=Bacillus sp. T33-2 TaxID=2054168 RepID=UPI000C76C10E|nr:DUF2512 family protein [Bacillus sp. T33-2]PLR95540.1 hypothetical protein CVD19_14090 [Bacillus sp. T33-2]